MPQQLKVFVSHSSTDKATCDALVTALRRAGADVWYDEHNLGAGQLLEEIQREVQARAIFVVLLSKAAFGSQWVRRETTWAFNLYNREPNRLILPVTIGQIEAYDFNNTWLFLEDFKRVEAPGFKPYPLTEAIERTQRLLELTPAGQRPAPAAPQASESLDDLLAKGKALLAQQKHAEAIPFFERATQLDPRSFDAWANLSRSYGLLQRWQEELAAADRALALDAGNVWAWGLKGQALTDLKRYDEALAALDRVLALGPNNAVAWNNKGRALGNLGRYQEALAAYDRALALDPNDAMAWNNKSYALNDLKRYQEALACAERALKIGENWQRWRNKADALRGLGRTREAEEAERRAKALGGRPTPLPPSLRGKGHYVEDCSRGAGGKPEQRLPFVAIVAAVPLSHRERG